MASKCTCGKKYFHGSSRSLVRRIGSRLPIKTKRLYIRVPGADSPSVQTAESEFRYEATGQRYVPNEEGLTLASHINDPRQLFSKATGLLDFDPEWAEGTEESTPMDMEEGEAGVAEGVETIEARDRISALESELARLKAQIAVYALSEEDSDAPVPPPPPPVPPPPIPPSQQVLRGSTDDADGPIWPSVSTPAPRQRPQQAAESLATPAGRPDMGDMLRDIGSVKLRTVHAAKSPGGTPLRPNKGKKEADPNDPASIIAHALRKKFSHRVFKDSPDKENLDHSDASINLGFESPTVKFLKK